MTESDETGERADETAEGGAESEKRSARERMGDGIRQGIGVLSAFKDALEETIQEARDRGDLSAERAKEVMKDALGRAQAAASEARERLDFAHQAELETLRERVVALEEKVFGERREARAQDSRAGTAPQGSGEPSSTGSDESS